MTPRLERSDVELFRNVVARRFGLQYDESKLDFLADVMRSRMVASGIHQPQVYLEGLDVQDRRAGEASTLIEHLTVNETYFFRNTDNFAALTELVLPTRLRERRNDRQLRILSAGCASGEEPYTIAIAVREALPDFAAWNVSITGVDLHPAMIAKARIGRYSAWSLRATPDDVRRRYFHAEGRDFVLDPVIRDMVSFEERNLVVDDPTLWVPSNYDLVFCRNVIMYLTPEGMRGVVQGIARALVPGGFLFLGHAETLRGLSQDFHLCHTHDTFYYQRRGEGDAVGAPQGDVSSLRAGDPAAPLEVIDTGGSWIDAIQHSSERIAALAGRRRSSAAEERAPEAWDLSLVLEAMRQERHADALELLAALPDAAHARPDALLLRAVLLANSGKLREAQEACTRLLELDSLSAGAHYVMALCREGAGSVHDAVEHDRTAVYLDAGFAMPHLHLGLMAKRAGDVATVRHELGQAMILLAREDEARVLLFGGGFSREALLSLCRTELRAAGGEA